jgi:hypothetical protein
MQFIGSYMRGRRFLLLLNQKDRLAAVSPKPDQVFRSGGDSSVPFNYIT